MRVSEYAAWMWNANAAMSTTRTPHSSKVRGRRWPGHVAEGLAVEVDLRFDQVELEVADHVDEHEAQAG